MKFKEGVIIMCEAFDGEEITCDGRNIKNIFKMKWM
jgi:hypothetical protein